MTTYYIDNVNGDDSNAGTSEGAGNAWASLAKAADPVAAGDKVYVKATGTDYTAQDGSNGCNMEITTAGTNSSVIVFEGYTSTPGDGGSVIIDAYNGGSNFTNVIKSSLAVPVYHAFNNFRFRRAAANGLDFGASGDYVKFYNCRIDGHGAKGVYGDDYLTFIKCEIDTNSTNPVDGDNGITCIACKIHGNGSQLQAQKFGMLYNLFYDGPNANQLYASSSGSIAVGNVFDGDNQANAVGIYFSGASSPQGIVALNNIFYDLKNGISASATLDKNVYTVDYNLYYSNTADVVNMTKGDHCVNGTGDPFTDSAARDYTLKTSSEAEDAGIDMGIW